MNIKFSIKTIEISGFASVVQALHLPFGGKVKSENYANFDFINGGDTDGFEYGGSVYFNDADMKLLQKLIKAGNEHAKTVRGLIVYAEITAPRYWWCEMDTYRIGTERLSSESTMHIQGKGLSTEELVKMKSELKEGTMQKRIQLFSYQALRNIYKQRRNHRLPEWHDFCHWIEKLPFANELIIGDLKKD